MLDTNPVKQQPDPATPWCVSELDIGKCLPHGVVAPLSISTQYLNGLPVPVNITLRNGLTFTVPANPGRLRYSPNFTVQVRYDVARDVNIDVGRILDDVDETDSLEKQLLKRATENATDNPYAPRSAFALDFNVTLEEVKRCGGALYLEELDIVISLCQGGYVPIHPAGSASMRMTERGMSRQPSEGFLLEITINDPHDQIGPRYMNLGGTVYKLPVIKDMTQKTGYYVVQSRDVETGYDAAEHETKFLSHDEFSGLFNVYSSQVDAETLGDPAGIRDREVKEREHAAKMEKLEREEKLRNVQSQFEELKHSNSVEAARREEEMARLSHELTLAEKKLAQQKIELDEAVASNKASREVDSLRNKDFYESRSYQRKDTSEVLKWLPTVLVGVAGLLAGFGFKATA